MICNCKWTVFSSTVESIPEGKCVLTGVAFDVDSGVTYVAAEKTLPQGGTEVEIWQLPAGEDSPPFATLTSEASAVFNVTQQVVSLAFLAESRQLVLILAGGDIAVLPVDDVSDGSEFDIIGSVEPGIRVAAWSPDESQIVLVNGNDELLIMTKQFDVLFENQLRPSDLGQEKQTALGWGSKQTQFHGSLGKAAASSESSVTGQGGIDKPSPDDDGKPRISWRGDGAFFVVSSLDPLATSDQAMRRLRFYSSNPPAHLSTSEVTPGLEGVLAWRPSGGLIATTQRFGYEGGGIGRPRRHDVLFFERCGLRRGEFGIRDAMMPAQVSLPKSPIGPWGYKVKEISWSTDSSVLLLWIERDTGDCVQLWTTGNYHWYLKQEVIPCGEAIRYTSVLWHPENSLRLICTTSHSIEDRTFAWDICASTSESDASPGAVAVVDGDSILVTPFKFQNVPPPMSSFKLSLSMPLSTLCPPPIHLSFSPNSRFLGLLYPNQHVQVWDLGLRTGSKGKIAEPKIVGPTSVSSPKGANEMLVRPRQIALSDTAVLVLGSDPTTGQQKDAIHVAHIHTISEASSDIRSMVPRGQGRLIGHAYYQDAQGHIYRLDKPDPAKIGGFPRFCALAQAVPTVFGELLVGLDSSGKLTSFSIPLEATKDNDDVLPVVHEVAHSVNSFAITPGFLVFTTTAHEINFAPFADLYALASEEITENEKNAWGVRRVERGSRIVCVVPANASVVLQLPRGNLETINPRPLVLAHVKAEVERGELRRAFLECRKHRVDLDLLVEFAPSIFREDPAKFVDQVPEVDYINLFLTGLGQSKRSQEQIASICDKFRVELEERDLVQYVQSILTAHVTKSPPDVESALQVLHTLREAEPNAVEDAVKYIIFLVDAEQLFNTALGMYDFALVLMIAQQSQKDPREYLPFLRELRAFDTYYQRFRINDYLGRRELALENLSLADGTRFEEGKNYVEKYHLYLKALELWKDRPVEHTSLLSLYAEWLLEHREFSKAGQAFLLARETKRAMFAFEKARMWKEAFSIVADTDISPEDIIEMGQRVAESLVSHSRYAEAARVYLDYVHDIPSAVTALSRGNDLSEAFRVVSIYNTSHLVHEVIFPEAMDLCSQFGDDVQEMTDQLNRQGQRLIELKEKKQLDPSSYYGHDEPNLHNVDALTDASGIMTQFTLYTKALTGTTAKRSQKSSKKAARKSGRKGTANEEEYILASLVKLSQRLEHVQRELSQLFLHLSRLSEDHHSAGKKLMGEVDKFGRDLHTIVDREWPTEQTTPDSAAPLTVPRPPKPVLSKDPWGSNLIGL